MVRVTSTLVINSSRPNGTHYQDNKAVRHIHERQSTMRPSILACYLLVASQLVATASSFVPLMSPLHHRHARSSTSLQSSAKTPEEQAIALQKATKAMTAFTNKYLENTDTKLCSDKSVPAVVIKGLAEHKVTLGAPLCPCRFYDDKEAEAKDGYWYVP